MKNRKLYLITLGVLAVAVLTSMPVFAKKISNLTSQKKSNSYEVTSTSENSNSNSISGGNGFDSGTETTLPAQNVPLVESNVSGNEQTVITSHNSYNYPNIVVQKGVPVVWTVNASADSLGSCNSYVVLPTFNVQEQLKQGSNVLKFTPTETGTFQYYCSMKMYTGTITVVDDIKNYDKSSVQNIVNSAIPPSGGGGCCGS